MKKNLSTPVVIITLLVVIGVILGIYGIAIRSGGNYTTITPEMREKLIKFPGPPGSPPAKPKGK